MRKVHANQSCVVRVNGLPIGVKEDQSFDIEDEIVRKFPWLFGVDEIEQATSGPGERRNVRKPA
jgi:hypothetical protein